MKFALPYNCTCQRKEHKEMQENAQRLLAWVERHQVRSVFLMCAACAVMLLFRRTDAFYFPQFYAEDGKLFFADAFNDGWASLFNRANGYFHVYPRFLALLGLSVGISVFWIPTLFVIGTLLVYVLVWAYIYWRMPTSFFQRCFAILATVYLPVGHEILMNLTNVQWLASLLIPLIVLGRPPLRKLGAALDVIILCFVCATGPFALIWLPVLALWSYMKWSNSKFTWTNLITLATVGLFAVIVAFSLVDHGSIERDGSNQGGSMFFGALQVLFNQLWYPIICIYVASVPFVLQLVLSAIALVGLRWLFMQLRRIEDPFGLILLIMSGVFFGVTLISYRHDLCSLSPINVGMRNFYLPALFIVWAALSLPSKSVPKTMLFWCIVIGWMGFQTGAFLGRKQFEDLNWKYEAAQIGNGSERVVPLNPPGWSMRLNAQPASDL
ncbi:MAG: hypothetical protein KA408_01760 [Flavobacteriales bacterium]|nr:hypothetical protein [Flavobacteriales bacterium]